MEKRRNGQKIDASDFFRIEADEDQSILFQNPPTTTITSELQSKKQKDRLISQTTIKQTFHNYVLSFQNVLEKGIDPPELKESLLSIGSEQFDELQGNQ